MNLIPNFDLNLDLSPLRPQGQKFLPVERHYVVLLLDYREFEGVCTSYKNAKGPRIGYGQVHSQLHVFECSIIDEPVHSSRSDHVAVTTKKHVLKGFGPYEIYEF